MITKNITVKAGLPFTRFEMSPLVCGDVSAYRIVYQTNHDLTNATFKVTAILPDGSCVVDSGETDGKTASYVVANNMYSIPGYVKLRLTVSDSTSILTENELVCTALSGNPEDGVDGDDRLPILSEKIQQADKAAQDANAALGNANNAIEQTELLVKNEAGTTATTGLYTCADTLPPAGSAWTTGSDSYGTYACVDFGELMEIDGSWDSDQPRFGRGYLCASDGSLYRIMREARPTPGSWIEDYHDYLRIYDGYTPKSTAEHVTCTVMSVYNGGIPAYNDLVSWVRDTLTKTNTVSYYPTGDYHPATKKYVDDAVAGAGGLKVIDLTGNTDTSVFSSPELKELVADCDGIYIVKSYEAQTAANDGMPIQLTQGPYTWILTVSSYSGDVSDSSHCHSICCYADSDIRRFSRMTTGTYGAEGWTSWTTFMFLTTNNHTAYTPTNNYHPATKKYVDDAVGNIGTILDSINGEVV